MRVFILFISLVAIVGCNGSTANKNVANVTPKQAKTPVPVYTYEIVKTYPHDPNAFTQGLVFRDGFLYESDGLEGESKLRKVEIETGKTLQKYDVPREYFAEGLAIFNNKLYQLTWREKTAFVYDMDFKLLKELKYNGEGWGLTNDDTHLIMSDGTHVLRFVDPETFDTVKTIVVKDDNGRPIYKLNELEYVRGEIWANIWHSEDIGKPNYIARIDPNSGTLLGWIDLGGISPNDVKADSENVLNGIAFDPATDRIFVTGKKWKNLYEITLKAK